MINVEILNNNLLIIYCVNFIKNTIFNYVVYNDYPSNATKTVNKGQIFNDYDSLIKRIKSFKFRDGNILRNALGEGLAAALEVIIKIIKNIKLIKKYLFLSKTYTH